MELGIIVLAMILMGLLVGWLSGVFWKESRPLGVPGDYIAAVAIAVVFGLIEYFLLPEMGFSMAITYLAISMEPAGLALLVLWLIRRSKR